MKERLDFVMVIPGKQDHRHIILTTQRLSNVILGIYSEEITGSSSGCDT